jgi:hypothetical protein
MCPIYVTKGRGVQARHTVEFTKSHCLNLVRFNYKNATESTKKSPCSNVPTICPLCAPGSPAVWKYSLEAHFRNRHRLTNPSHFPCPVGQSQSEKYGMKIVWQGHFKKRKSYNSKSKRLAPHLAVSEAHRAGLPITASATHRLTDNIQDSEDKSDNNSTSDWEHSHENDNNYNENIEDNNNNNNIVDNDNDNNVVDNDSRPETLHHGLHVPSPSHSESRLPSPACLPARLSLSSVPIAVPPMPTLTQAPIPITTTSPTATVTFHNLSPHANAAPVTTTSPTASFHGLSPHANAAPVTTTSPTASFHNLTPDANAAPDVNMTGGFQPPSLPADNVLVQADVRPRRTRKANVLSLNACECGITIPDDEIQKGKTVMKCTVEGCETVWVSNSLIHYRCFH